MTTTTATLRPILMPAVFFCEAPLVPTATTDKMRAGMEKERKIRDAPHAIRVQRENTRAHIAIPEWSSPGGYI